jgi:2-oxoglutarate ferredoxin oxidoreductase subunit beta
VGIFTERDALRLMADGHDFEGPASAVMFKEPATLPAEAARGTAISRMHYGGFRRLPIVDADGKPIGLISLRLMLRLTKGQHSPTSPLGRKTKTSPAGSIENPLHPVSLAFGCEASFVARSLDVDIRHMQYVLTRAAEHRGTAFVEVYQNCNVFYDGAWSYATEHASKPDNVLQLEHGKPLVFGKERNKGIRLNGMDPEVVQIGDGISKADLQVHDERATEPSLAYLLSRLRHEDGFPEPIGVFRAVDAPLYEEGLQRQIEQARAAAKISDLQSLFNSDDT